MQIKPNEYATSSGYCSRRMPEMVSTEWKAKKRKIATILEQHIEDGLRNIVENKVADRK